ncbi:unnamed protein product [Rhizophagus irregularis]|uniref:Gem-associated protein 7-like n=1 Tax=Rhizophagus irregularis TaxID=588596 RepID=A0A2I1FUE7_9GLOM|nr:hypothetical protein RhiirA4_536882 [Rhizophagus irregularis]CAB4422870.1 unnamed protein product [Rhizophagus irregularis]
MKSSEDAKMDTSTLLTSHDDQKIRALLRQRSLFFWLELNKRKSNTIARLYENTVIKGKFEAVDANETSFRFENWESPVGTYDHVVIRGSDIEVLEFEFTK